MCAVHAKRVTIMKKDMVLARRLRGDRNFDFIDRNEYIDDRFEFMSLPYFNVKEGMNILKERVSKEDQ